MSIDADKAGAEVDQGGQLILFENLKKQNDFLKEQKTYADIMKNLSMNELMEEILEIQEGLAQEPVSKSIVARATAIIGEISKRCQSNKASNKLSLMALNLQERVLSSVSLEQ